jgi:hypothetical protein
MDHVAIPFRIPMTVSHRSSVEVDIPGSGRWRATVEWDEARRVELVLTPIAPGAPGKAPRRPRRRPLPPGPVPPLRCFSPAD